MTSKTIPINDLSYDAEPTARPSSKLVAGALALSLMGMGAVGYDHGKAFYHATRLSLIKRVLEEELARHPDIAGMQGETLRKKALQLRIENEDLKARLVDILVIAEGGSN